MTERRDVYGIEDVRLSPSPGMVAAVGVTREGVARTFFVMLQADGHPPRMLLGVAREESDGLLHRRRYVLQNTIYQQTHGALVWEPVLADYQEEA